MGWTESRFREIEEAIEKLKAGYMKDHKILVCPKHFSAAYGYSRLKEFFVCNECKIEDNENIVYFKEYKEAYGIIFKDNLKMKEFKPILKKKIDETRKKFNIFIRKVEKCTEKIKELNSNQEKSIEYEEKNYALLSKIIETLDFSKNKLSYDSEIFKQIYGKFNIGKLIKRHFEVKKFITIAKVKELKFFFHRLYVYMMKINCLNILASLVSLKDIRDDQYCAMIYCDIFKRKAKVNCIEDEFCAFDGANLLPEVTHLLDTPFKNTEGLVFYTKSLSIKEIHYAGLNIICSISPNGILAIYRYNSGNHVLGFYDILTGNCSGVDWITDFTTTVFYEDKAFLFVHGSYFVYIKNVFGCMSGDNNLESFEKVPSGGICLFMDPSVAFSTGSVFYTNGDIIDEKIVRFDLKKLTYQEYDFTMEPTISRTGIFMKGISFLANKDKGILAMTQEGEINSSVKSDTPGFVIIPSKLSPEDISKSLIVADCGKCFCNGESCNITPAFKPAGKLAIVRIFRDVFLVRDKKDASWKYIRIHVP